MLRLGRWSTLLLCIIRDKLIKYICDKLNNNQSSPKAISHKELKNLLKKAKKEILLDTTDDNESNETQELNDLIINWTKTSQKILKVLQKKDPKTSNNMSSKSLMAFGAMGAHISMALQALKATESDQWKLNIR